ncbi:hypothetical protein Q1695_009974 [Nippostrongylus brasiliensis]|nr:hypothetical protein Q1695_009974 [Nippostrongylus brasiliensis]
MDLAVQSCCVSLSEVRGSSVLFRIFLFSNVWPFLVSCQCHNSTATVQRQRRAEEQADDGDAGALAH